MGELRSKDGRRCILQPEHLIGRGPQCALRLVPDYVSSQHAVIRFNDGVWQLLDRGSLNGTFLNGVKVLARTPYDLGVGSVIAFGHVQERWELTDAGDPRTSVVSLTSGEIVHELDGAIGVPSNDDPQCALFRTGDGSWRLEYPDGPTLRAEDGMIFDVADQRWQFVHPISFAATAVAEGETGPAELPLLDLAFAPDEEFVVAELRFADRVVELGSRSHNYLLLTLARARVADAESAVPESSCGWVYKEDLARSLQITAQQVDGEVFRIRKHFGHHGLATEAEFIIERRPRTTQLRLGLPRVQLRRL